MAGDSSFDPLALVKAMGPQRDPYSWAEAYAADAAKSAQLREEIKNRLLIHESDQKARAHEGEKDRGARDRLVRFQQGEANKRAQMATDRYKLKFEQAGKNAVLGPDVITPQDYQMGTIGIGGPQINRGDYETIIVFGKPYHKKKGAPMPNLDPRRLPDPDPTVSPSGDGYD